MSEYGGIRDLIIEIFAKKVGRPPKIHDNSIGNRPGFYAAQNGIRITGILIGNIIEVRIIGDWSINHSITVPLMNIADPKFPVNDIETNIAEYVIVAGQEVADNMFNTINRFADKITKLEKERQAMLKRIEKWKDPTL